MCCARRRGSSPNAKIDGGDVATGPGSHNEFEELLRRFRKLPVPVRVVYARPRTFIALALGIATFLLLYLTRLELVTRLLIGWDVFAALYLILVYVMMLRSQLGNIRRHAILQDDGRFLILLLTALGAFASIAAIVFELGARHGGTGLALATLTITLSWATVHSAFALHYAHEYYRGVTPGGLQFPSGDQHDHADYWDFVYFSFVIGMTAQVSDVGITDKTIRRTATVHGIISFIYNTALVALTVNIAASAI
jgi:uncharacterized membrane protein